MARITCQVLQRPGRTTFIWSQDNASFEPYHLSGLACEEFRSLANEARVLLGTDDSRALAAVGQRLYQAIFPAAAHGIRDWLNDAKDIETLEIVSDAPGVVPWNAVLPDERNHDGFWGMRYALAAGRRVNPLRELPVVEAPEVLFAVDPAFRQSLSDKERERLESFAKEKSLLIVETALQVSTAFKSQPPDVVAFFCRADGQALLLGSDRITPDDLATVIEEGGGNPDPIILFNLSAAGADVASPARAFLDSGLHGLIACEALVKPDLAGQVGVAFLKSFLYEKAPVGAALQNARREVGSAGLAYTAYLPAHVLVVEEGADVEGPTPEPLPDEPYRPLAPYDREDLALFTGREDDVAAFTTQFDAADTRLVVLHGGTGVGKSSFLRAGVVPFLEDSCIGYRAMRDRRPEDETPVAEDDHVVLSIRASQDLLGQLAEALCAFCAQPYVYTTPTGQTVTVDLPELLRAETLRQSSSTSIQAGVTGIQSGEPPAPSETPASIKPVEITAGVLWEKMHEDTGTLPRLMTRITERLPHEVVILIEQGEEFFATAKTPAQERRRRQVLSILSATVAAGSGKWILSMRSDFFGRLAHYFPRDAKLADYLLAPLTQDQLVEAMLLPTVSDVIPYSVEAPFARYGFAFEDGLAAKLAGDVLKAAREQHISPLPLMQALCAGLVALTKTRPDRVIHLADVTRFGGVPAALSKYVEGRIKAMPVPSTEQRALRELFEELYLREPDGTVVRQTLPAGDVAQRWKGGNVGQTVEYACADEFRLLEVNSLLIGGKEGDYVSLSQDALAQLGATWAEEKKRQQVGWTKTVDLLWVFIPLTVLAVAVTVWAMRQRGGAGASDKEFTKAEVRKILGQQQQRFARDSNRLQYFLYVHEADNARASGNWGQMRANLNIALESLENARTPFEWNYLNRLCLLQKDAAPQKLLLSGYVNAVALSPDSKTLATVDATRGQIVLYDLEKDATRGTLTGHDGTTHALAFSADGQLLVSAGADKTVKIWDATLKETKALKTLSGHDGAVLAVAISQDGTRVASASADKTARLWDVKDGKELFKYAGHTEPVQALTFGPADKTVITGGADGKIFVWETNSDKRSAELTGFSGPVAAVALSRDGKVLAGGGSDHLTGTEAGVIRQWDVASGKPQGPVIVQGAGVTALAYAMAKSHDAETPVLLSGGTDSVIHGWDPVSGQAKVGQHGHMAPVSGLALSKDGKTMLASVGKDESARVWNLPVLLQGDALPHGGWVCSVVFSKNDKVLVSAGRDGAIKFWDVPSGRPLSASIDKVNGAIASLALHSDGDSWKLAAGIATPDNTGEIRVWEVKVADTVTAKLLHTLKDKDHPTGITAVAFSPNGKQLASASYGKNALLWDAASGKVEQRLEGHKGSVRCLAWDLQGKTLASGGDDKTIRIWNPANGKELAVLEKNGHQAPITALAYLPEPQAVSVGQQQIPVELLSGSADQTLRYWSVPFRFAPPNRFQGHGGPISSVACRPGGLIVSASWDHMVKSWLRGGADNFTFAGHTGPVRAVAISHDSLTLASASHDGTVRLWRSTPPRFGPKKAPPAEFEDD